MNMHDDDRLAAAIDVIGRTGAVDFEVGYLDDDVPAEMARWWAKARYGGQIVTVEDQANPGDAAEKLAEQLLEGGLCVHCLRTITVHGDEEDRCRWMRGTDERWHRGCEDEFPDTDVVSTKRKLAIALQRAGCPRLMVQAALEGYYDDFDGPLAMPINQLVNDLRGLGLEELAQQAINGEFDGTKEESEAWAKSPDGQVAFAELIGGMTREQRDSGPIENRKQRRARERRERRR